MPKARHYKDDPVVGWVVVPALRVEQKVMNSIQTEFILKNYKTMEYVEIGKVIGKTKGAIRNWVWRHCTEKKKPLLTNEEKQIIREHYQNRIGEPIGLDELALKMGRERTTICVWARKMGLTAYRRKDSLKEIEAKKKRMKGYFESHGGHPKGMLGKHQTQEVKDIISAVSLERWKKVTPEESRARNLKILKTREENGHLLRPRIETTWKCGWAEIGGKKNFYRSRWERNYARYLQWLKEKKQIIDWFHEPKTFWFEKIKRGCVSYKPDFLVIENDGKEYYHEVKGWMDERSQTKIKRMAIYYPEIKMKLIDANAYKSLKNDVKNLVPEWEDGR